MSKRALISVSDKTGIVDFARGLVRLGYEIVSTGGTQSELERAGIEVKNVSELTGFPECLDGRVKTLHPAVHAGILAMRQNRGHMAQLAQLEISPIDIVAINLYPFGETVKKPDVTLEDAIENIDIGGPAMLRAAAKNYPCVISAVDPADYPEILERLAAGSDGPEYRFGLACKVFSHTTAYDAAISRWLFERTGDRDYPDRLTLTFEKGYDLRYGENPHQKAAFYREVMPPKNSLALAKCLNGKQLSFNNLNDTHGALELLREFDALTPCAVAVKHANPCGVGLGSSLADAFRRARDADPVSIFGGIVALNQKVDLETAKEMSDIFLEIIVAPGYDGDALEHLKQKKNLRLLELAGCQYPYGKPADDIKKIGGGLLIQETDELSTDESKLEVVTKRAPTEGEMRRLKIAMKIVKHVKSNAICLMGENQTVGIGPGQTNRVTALDLAISYAGERAAGSVMASDAFFPFPDCVEHAGAAGVTAIIQPGGSVRDEESIKACDRHNIAMVFTGIRHFKH
jgi:phosphoribosylaminoimidazolecarboxamide formyltransferase/IMP cyclohydrolase